MIPDDVATKLSFLNQISPKSSESDVEQKVIIPLLRLLGYEERDWHTQYPINNSVIDFLVKPVDAKVQHPPYLAIEAKAPKIKLSPNIWQIKKYLRQSGAVIGMLTNGYAFRLLFNCQGKILNLYDCDRAKLISDYSIFYKILSKEVSLRFTRELYYHSLPTHLDFGKSLAAELLPPEQVKKLKILTPQRKITPMIITTFNNKGGVGKTTTTINVAAALNKLGYRVLLIDIDAQANLTQGLGIDPLADLEIQGKKVIIDLLLDPKLPLKEIVISKRWGDIKLDIVPSHILLHKKENDINQLVNRDLVLARKLTSSKYSYQENYDFVFIDPPPSFSVVNTISLMASSAILIPTQLAPYPIRALEYVIDRAKAVESFKGEALPILGIAVSMYNKGSSRYNADMKEQMYKILEKCDPTNEINLFPENTWIPSLNVVARATSLGKEYPLCHAEFDDTLNSNDKQSAQDAFDCYLNLAQHLLSITQK